MLLRAERGKSRATDGVLIGKRSQLHPPHAAAISLQQVR
jgi:hypothetical protein